MSPDRQHTKPVRAFYVHSRYCVMGKKGYDREKSQQGKSHSKGKVTARKKEREIQMDYSCFETLAVPLPEDIEK